MTLDLNGFYYAAPDGPRTATWRDVIVVSSGRWWVRVWLENGVVLRLRVPRPDRDWLVDVIEQLLRHHHRDLFGICPDPGAHCASEAQLQLLEIRQSRAPTS